MRLLTDHASVYRLELDPDWTPEEPAGDGQVEVLVWEGAASLSDRGSRQASGLEPTRTIDTGVLRVPTPDSGGPDDLIEGGEIVYIDRFPNRHWYVAHDRRRTTAVLQRFVVVDSEYGEQVPR